jgi:hypothetical protein
VRPDGDWPDHHRCQPATPDDSATAGDAISRADALSRAASAGQAVRLGRESLTGSAGPAMASSHLEVWPSRRRRHGTGACRIRNRYANSCPVWLAWVGQGDNQGRHPNPVVVVFYTRCDSLPAAPSAATRDGGVAQLRAPDSAHTSRARSANGPGQWRPAARAG